MIKYSVTVEYRYNGVDKYECDTTHKTIVDTLIVTNILEDSIKEGNKFLELLESKFDLNNNYNVKQRLSIKKRLI